MNFDGHSNLLLIWSFVSSINTRQKQKKQSEKPPLINMDSFQMSDDNVYVNEEHQHQT